jgi:hypothetical protein
MSNKKKNKSPLVDEHIKFEFVAIAWSIARILQNLPEGNLAHT